MDLSDAILDTIFTTLEQGSTEIRQILEKAKRAGQAEIVLDLDAAAIRLDEFRKKLYLIKKSEDKEHGQKHNTNEAASDRQLLRGFLRSQEN